MKNSGHILEKSPLPFSWLGILAFDESLLVVVILEESAYSPILLFRQELAHDLGKLRRVVHLD